MNERPNNLPNIVIALDTWGEPACLWSTDIPVSVTFVKAKDPTIDWPTPADFEFLDKHDVWNFDEGTEGVAARDFLLEMYRGF